MMTVTNERRILVVCDCCKQEILAGNNVPEAWRQALEQCWIRTAEGNEYCAECAVGMRQK